jgi:hypothetical protein
MAAIANDGGSESLRKFSARLRYFVDRLRAAGIVVAGMNAVLVDPGSCAQNAQRVEEMYLVSLFGQADGSSCAIDARSSYSNLRSHNPLQYFPLREKTTSSKDRNMRK